MYVTVATALEISFTVNNGFLLIECLFEEIALCFVVALVVY